MKEYDHGNEDCAPLSYRGARRIVWLIVLLIIGWFILRSIRPVLLLFAIVFLIAIVLNPIVGWLERRRLPRAASVLLLVVVLAVLSTTFAVFAIPPLINQL
jgi:predicted PurR-regulated permease PerM